MIWRVHPVNPEKRIIGWIVDALRDDQVVILPTDTVYAFVCSSLSPRAIEKLYRLKELPESKPLALLCGDVAMAANFAQGISNQVFRFMKSATPGPFTFVFKANRNMDRRATGKRKEVGIRIVDHPLIQALIEELGAPLISTSVPEEEFFIDPDHLDQVWGKRVFAVVDGGVKENTGSSVLDCADGEIRLVRSGAGAEILARLGIEE